jgi:hypothetical protein
MAAILSCPRRQVKRPSRGDEDDSLPVIHIDDRELSWDDFGRTLCTYACWDMRVVFVPDDD